MNLSSQWPKIFEKATEKLDESIQKTILISSDEKQWWKEQLGKYSFADTEPLKEIIAKIANYNNYAMNGLVEKLGVELDEDVV